MKPSSLLMLSAIATAPFFPATVNAANLPFGVMNDVSSATVASWGFTEVFSETYATSGRSISSILSGFDSDDYLMMAARRVGSSTFDVLAAASIHDATFDTGGTNTTHQANGVEWYFSNNYSWGFAGLGDLVNLHSCDTAGSSWDGVSPNERDRLCWHTSGGNLDGGWRAGGNIDLNGSQDWERVVFRASADEVPEPASLALLGLGFAGMRLVRRKAV